MTETWLEGISVITPTTRKTCISQILSNFLGQRFVNKELIIIINNDEIQPSDFQLATIPQQFNIQIYQIPAKESLGSCLNMAIKKAKYKYIAKFDDDDYYAPAYLDEMYDAFNKTGCDVVCKHSIFYYLEEYGELAMLSVGGRNRTVIRGAGATICAKRAIFETIQFAKLRVGTDTDFFRQCLQEGYKCYSTSNYNYLCFRSKDAGQHTWKITAKELRKSSMRYFIKKMTYEEACLFVSQYK